MIKEITAVLLGLWCVMWAADAVAQQKKKAPVEQASPIQVPNKMNVEIAPGGVVMTPGCVDRHLQELPKLAARLGIQPTREPGDGAVVFEMCDGRHFNFVQIIEGVLDRLDKATKK